MNYLKTFKFCMDSTYVLNSYVPNKSFCTKNTENTNKRDKSRCSQVFSRFQLIFFSQESKSLANVSLNVYIYIRLRR